MISNCKLALVFLVYITATAICKPTVPEWSNIYTVKGVLHLPYAEIEEPFHAWYDGVSKNSRIDYYDGMAKTYQLGENDYGTNLKVVPFTTEDVLNQITCFQVNGTKDDQVTPQSILPSLEGFTYLGTEKRGDLFIDAWTLTVTEWEKKNIYTLWVHYDKNGTAVPLKYEMKGYNTLLGSHYDHYYLEYHTYQPEIVSSNVFEVEAIDCRSFPGPGKQHTHSLNPMAEFIRPEKTQHVESRFNDFIDTHGKKYADVQEHTLRKEIFRQNARFIESVNRQNKEFIVINSSESAFTNRILLFGFTEYVPDNGLCFLTRRINSAAKAGFNLAINHLADKTEKEINSLRGRVSSGGYNGGQPFPFSNVDRDSLPDQYDWRLYGAVTPVKDQAVCGSCWAFGAVGNLEGALFLKNGRNLVRLSEQALIDCSWGYGNNGCDGGEDFRSYQWVLKHGGIPLDGDYIPYLGEDGFCYADLVNKTAAITGWVNVTYNDENALRLAIFKQGPISVSIDASQKTFSFYSNGVYYDENCGNKDADLDHAVLAVGYGTIDGEDYWLIKNSWSTYWGNDGYILMSARDNNCGVMTAATYVTM